MNKSNVPAKRNTKTTSEAGSALDLIRNARPKSALVSVDKPNYLSAATEARRPRIVFGIDATSSRQATWNDAKKITDVMFTALPGEVDIALAVHSAGTVSKFTDFSSDVARFRHEARSVSCEPGHTKLCNLMQQTLEKTGVKVFVYVGDAFEESDAAAYALADKCKTRGIRAIMLHDESSQKDQATRAVFEEIARRTGGVCADFCSVDLSGMKDILQAVVVLAAGGIKLLEQKRAQLPGAAKLLPYLK